MAEKLGWNGDKKLDIKCKRLDRINTISINRFGEELKLIRYGNARDIDVEFEDGTVLYSRVYEDFKNGAILKPNWIYNKYLNEEKYNTQGCLMKIIKINRTLHDIDIQFIDKNMAILEHQQYSNFKRGTIRNPYFPSVFNYGYVGESLIDVKSYNYWHGILQRCYSKEYHKKKPSYENCKVCEEWLNYSNFKVWFDENYYDIEEQLDLDKDILSKENKIYSPETCLLIPKRINLLYNTNSNTMIGVNQSKGCKTYKASISKGKDRIYLGAFKTEIEAFLCYKEEKEKYVKEIAEEYKNKIPNKIYDALIKWELTL